MKYVEVKYKIPEGYEHQVTAVVMRKIEAILSQIYLKPTPSKKDDFDKESSEAKIQNNIKVDKN